MSPNPASLPGKKPGPPVCDDLVKRNFTAASPDLLWLVDITEHWTKEGKLYLCANKDVSSRRIVGYSISDRMKALLAVDALNNAVARRGDRPPVSDQARPKNGGQINWT